MQGLEGYTVLGIQDFIKRWYKIWDLIAAGMQYSPKVGLKYERAI